jgi:hypothetical protein
MSTRHREEAMKKILLGLIVLVVVGLPGLVAAEPGENQTLHTLWLPVIGGVERPETCNYTVQWDVPEPYVVKLNEPITVAFSWKYDGGGRNYPDWVLIANSSPDPNMWSKIYRFRNPENDESSSASEIFVIPVEENPLQPGEYWWSLATYCRLSGSTIPGTSPWVNLIVIYE